MKQTQTKMFDFSDVGLDFCAGSKNLFPDRFKKMLSLGYNEQTVSSVAVAGDQVTLSYGVSHGYVADRVLQVTASGGFSKEVYIDSIDGLDVVCTVLDGVTTGLSGTITTKVAPLGWELVYEVDNIHIYKMQHIDDTFRYVRLCFQNNANYRNRVAPCVGKTFDLSLGVITDATALNDTASALSPNLYAWEFSYNTNSSYNNYTYTQGYSTFGRGVVIGSIYHLCIMHRTDSSAWKLSGVLASKTINYEQLNHPILVCEKSGSPSGSYGFSEPYQGKFMLGNIICVSKFGSDNATNNNMDAYPQAYQSFLPASIDTFNTTTAEPISLYIEQNGQFTGYVVGVYKCKYGSSSTPTISLANSPTKTTDIDFSADVYIQPVTASSTNGAYAIFYAVPLEDIKNGY